jgi:hypothetical protein
MEVRNRHRMRVARIGLNRLSLAAVVSDGHHFRDR